MRPGKYLLAIGLALWVDAAVGNSMWSIRATRVELSFENESGRGNVLVRASREKFGDTFRLATLTILAQDREISVAPTLLTVIPNPDLGSIELGYSPGDRSAVFITIEFGEFPEERDPDYVRYRVDLRTDEVEIESVSNPDLLLR